MKGCNSNWDVLKAIQLGGGPGGWSAVSVGLGIISSTESEI